jgi:tetratricopeptide (TPR) repeat protein
MDGWRAGLPLVLLLVGASLYADALSGPFIYDDVSAIVDNPAVRSLWPLAGREADLQTALAGRPVVATTIAANYAIGGLDVRGYHAVNVAIHLLCALTLYGVVRLSPPRPRPGLAFAAALLWIVHPLNTETVNYVVQRTESLMSLFYLLTLYCAVRSRTSRHRRLLWVGAVLLCLAGVGCKESIVTCPLAVLLHDWAYDRRGLRARWPLHAGLASTWLALGALLATAPRSQSVGLGLGVSAWDYFKNQCVIVSDYLRHAFWPVDLVFDYGLVRDLTFAEVRPQAALLAALFAAALLLFSRRPQAGFPALAFFLLLAPTSSFVPVVTEVGAERRMYLALAALAVLAALAAGAAVERLARGWTASARRALSLVPLLVVAGALGATTVARNREYRSAEAIWRSATLVTPLNARAHNGLGRAIQDAGRPAEALPHYRRALELAPADYHANYNMGVLMANLGRHAEALPYLVRAVEGRPGRAAAHHRLGSTHLELGHLREAVTELGTAVRLEPRSAAAHSDLALALARSGDLDGAVAENTRALEIDPRLFAAHNNLGNLHLALGQAELAVESYGRALEIEPGMAEAHNNLGRALAALGREEQALAHFRRAAELAPGLAVAHRNLGELLLSLGRREAARASLLRAQALEPDDERVRTLLETARADPP